MPEEQPLPSPPSMAAAPFVWRAAGWPDWRAMWLESDLLLGARIP